MDWKTAQILAGISALTLAGQLYGTYASSKRLTWIFKPATSALFIAAALAGNPSGMYGSMVLAGLVLCFAGDVLLIPDSKKWFLFGLVAFLLGHVCYIIAFGKLLFAFSRLDPQILVPLAVAALAILVLFWPKLGNMKGPVVAYVIVISTMVWFAWSIYLTPGFSGTSGRFIVAGATCFYLSDVSVAIDRFIRKSWVNKMWGLPLYYSGQFLLALSAWMIK
jgi:uncharacterized membrane protein YhhN